MNNFAIFAGTTYLGTFAYSSSQVAKNGGLAIARRKNISGSISVFAVVEIVAIAA